MSLTRRQTTSGGEDADNEADQQRAAEELRRKHFGVFAEFLDPDGWNTPTIQMCGYTVRMSLPTFIERIYNFPVDARDVIIATFPKSGTTFMQHIVWLLVTQDFDTTEPIDQRVIELDLPIPYPVRPENLDLIAAKAPPRLFKTHVGFRFLPKDALKGRIIYVYRNPKDVAVSYYHHARAIKTICYRKSFEHFVEMFMNGKVNFGPWTKHVLDFYHASLKTDRILLVAFEDLKKDRMGTIKKVAKFLDLEVSEDTLKRVYETTSFEAMQNNEAVNYDWIRKMGFRDPEAEPFLRKGVVGDWRNYFTKELAEKFDSHVKHALTGCDLNFVDVADD